MVSTPTIKGACRIDNAFETSDKRFFKVPCPDCGQFQIMKWKNVRWDKDKPETAEYCCEHCGSLWNDPKRWKAVRRGFYESTAEFNGVAGFHISELYSSWSRLSNMATAFLEAKKFPDQLKTFINLSLGETWEDKGDSLDENELLSKREDFDKDTVPEDVLLITAGVDVQDTSLHITYLGYTKNEIIHVIHHEVLNGDPSTNMLWMSLDKQLNQVFTRKDGKRIKVASACIDSGGHFTQSVYAYCKNRFTRRFFAIKGVSGDRAIFPKRPSLNNTARIPLFLIGVDSAKDVIFNRVRREGLIKFSNSLDQDYFSELISERVVTRFRQGAPVRVYERTRRHNEALDCFVYAFASFHGLNPNFKAIEFNINKQRNEEENKNETRPRQKTIVRNNFINSWDK
jgi:phage terminase large subunit GpA-like protein